MTVIKRVGLFALFPILGAVISIVYYNALQQGAFVKWISLGKPSADRVVRVISVDYVETASGDIYRYEYVNTNKGNWVKSEEVPLALDTELPIGECMDAYKLPSLHRFIDSKMACEQWGVGIYLTIMAVDDVGNVYLWGKGIGEYDGMLILASPFIGAVMGFVVAILVLIIVLLIAAIRSLMSRS